MNILHLIPCLLYLTFVKGFWPFDLNGDGESVQRIHLKHVFGIEPFLHLHKENPFNLFNMFYDDETDEYEEIIMPKDNYSNIVRIRKPRLKPHPKVQELLLDYLYKKKIPELSNYLDKIYGERDK